MPELEKLVTRNKDNFIKHFNEVPSFFAYAPGRINIIGEHTDYNQGLAMPCAINRWVTVSMSERNDNKVEIISLDFNGEMTFELGKSYEPKTSWEKYIYGCILLFKSSFTIPSGFNALISGNVPIGSGVSSSAALEVAFMNALNYFSKAAIDGLTLIKLCQQVEHQYLHVKSGLLDQYASQFSKAGKALILDFETLTHKYIEADLLEYTWVLCDSKVQRSLTGTKYSERVDETQSALSNLKKQLISIKGFRSIKEKDISLIENVNERKRIKHYINENERVLAAKDAMRNNDMPALGKLITASHFSLKNDYEISCDEIDFLVTEALASNYCIGSRMMGGGFGGCTINLVKKENAIPFSNVISKAYKERFNIETEINIYESVDGAGIYA